MSSQILPGICNCILTKDNNCTHARCYWRIHCIVCSTIYSFFVVFFQNGTSEVWNCPYKTPVSLCFRRWLGGYVLWWLVPRDCGFRITVGRYTREVNHLSCAYYYRCLGQIHWWNRHCIFKQTSLCDTFKLH